MGVHPSPPKAPLFVSLGSLGGLGIHYWFNFYTHVRKTNF
jgi:hypothetical protein